MHRPDRCRGCGRDLTLAVVAGVQARQEFDLPPVRLHVVEHRVERRRCACGQVTAADFPAQARAPACYRPGVRALGVYLGAWQHLPVAWGAELLGHLLGAQVSSGSLSGVAGRGAVALTGFAARARTVLADAEVVHVDETRARVAGRLHWVHSTSTPRWSWYRVDAKRGKQAMDAAGTPPAQTTGGSVPAGAAGHPPHRGLPVPGRPARPPTNNQAERDLRMVKLQHKISGCWRTLAGAQAFLTVRSYLATGRKHGVNPVEVLRQLFDGNPWMPAPGST